MGRPQVPFEGSVPVATFQADDPIFFDRPAYRYRGFTVLLFPRTVQIGQGLVQLIDQVRQLVARNLIVREVRFGEIGSQKEKCAIIGGHVVSSLILFF
jgi:hypothetical protein